MARAGRIVPEANVLQDNSTGNLPNRSLPPSSKPADEWRIRHERWSSAVSRRAFGAGGSVSFAELQQVGAMSALQAIMEEHGLDGSAIIASEGIAPGALDRPENFIRVSVLGDLLARCAELASCPQLGLHFGARAGVESLGILGSLMGSCDTLGDAIRALRIICKSWIAARSSSSRRSTMRSC